MSREVGQMARRKQRVDRHNRRERQIKNEGNKNQSFEEVYGVQERAALDAFLHSLGADTGSIVPAQDLSGLRGQDTHPPGGPTSGDGTETTAISAAEIDRALRHLR